MSGVSALQYFLDRLLGNIFRLRIDLHPSCFFLSASVDSRLPTYFNSRARRHIKTLLRQTSILRQSSVQYSFFKPSKSTRDCQHALILALPYISRHYHGRPACQIQFSSHHSFFNLPNVSVVSFISPAHVSVTAASVSPSDSLACSQPRFSSMALGSGRVAPKRALRCACSLQTDDTSASWGTLIEIISVLPSMACRPSAHWGVPHPSIGSP